tara:strand:+ start:194 stop:1735 length:1542 start_codon:yes stop_codon:yes gene_type:complete
LKKNFLFETLFLISLGGLTSLSLPPFNWFFINFFTFSILFIFLVKRIVRKVSKYFFYYGWLFGFGYFFSSLYWITISLTFDKNFALFIPLALIIIPSFLGLFYASATFIFSLFKQKNILSSFFLFSLLFGITEFIRGTILTGFPWNLIVYSLSKNLEFINILSIIGTYSLNLIVISFFTLPALLILRKSKKEIGVFIVFLLLSLIFFYYGIFQKNEYFKNKLEENPFTIRIIGSNISLDRFYEDIQAETIINELISISSPEKGKNILFIWPEGIIPDTYQDELNLYKDIFTKYFDKNHLIALGITKREIQNKKYKYFNSFSIFDKELELKDSYNKIKLVPFGEFLPLEKILKKIGFKTITNNIESFSRGENREFFKIKKDNQEIKFLPLICYEIIYSGNLTNDFNFDLILNISEDGWFGNSIGPEQHFSHSIFRAIENGKYILRSSNNGMAAIINPIGQIEEKINYGETGFIDFEKRRSFHKTIFSSLGNNVFLILILLYIFIIFSFNRFCDE